MHGPVSIVGNPLQFGAQLTYVFQAETDLPDMQIVMHHGLVDGHSIVTSQFTDDEMQWCERAFGGVVRVGFERLDVLVPRQAVVGGVWSRESSTCHAHRQALSEIDEELGERWTLAGPLIGTHGFCTSVDEECAYHAVPPVVLIGMLGYVMRLANESNVAVSLACEAYDIGSHKKANTFFRRPYPNWLSIAVDQAAFASFMAQLETESRRSTTYVLEKSSDKSRHLVHSRLSSLRLVIFSLDKLSQSSIIWRHFGSHGIAVPISRDKSLIDGIRHAGLCSKCSKCSKTQMGKVSVEGQLYSAGLQDIVHVCAA